MPHSTHKVATYRDDQQVWVTFCEWCGFDTEEKLEKECSQKYKQVDKELKQY